MTSWSSGCGLAVDHEYLELRERLGRTGEHHLPRPAVMTLPSLPHSRFVRLL
jgi:hypothetical protein